MHARGPGEKKAYVRCAAVYEALIAGRDIVPVRIGCSFY
jgi:hypothetical protein